MKPFQRDNEWRRRQIEGPKMRVGGAWWEGRKEGRKEGMAKSFIYSTVLDNDRRGGDREKSLPE